MTTHVETVNLETLVEDPAEGILSWELEDLVGAGTITITAVRFTVECVADAESLQAVIASVAPTIGGSPYDSGDWSISGGPTDRYVVPGAGACYVGVDYDEGFIGAGFLIADGAATCTYVFDPPLESTTTAPVLMVQGVNFEPPLEASYRVGTITVFYGGETPTDPGAPVPLPVQVDVYEVDNATLVCSLTHNETTPADARQVRALRGKVSLDEAGDGELTVDYDHPQVAELTGGRFVRVIEGDRTPLAFRIDRDRDVRIPPPGSGDADKTFTVRGAGPLDYMRLGRVLPWLAVGAKPVSRRRRFDWSSPQLDTTDWTSPFDQDRLTSEPGKPFGIPALFTTKWIWGEVEDDTMTIGECCFRRIFEITGDDPVQVSAFASADDGFEDAWQAVNVVEANEAFPGKVWHRPYRSPVLLDPGEYVYAAKARNDGGKGAFICDAWSVGAGGLIDQVFMSGVPEDNEYDALYGDWLCYMDPAGEWFTPGEIVRILVEEAQARGEIPDVTLDFDDTLDSAGGAWPKIEFECDATGTIADALELLAAIHVDVAMSHEGLVLSMWNKDPGRGTASTVSVQHANLEIAADATETDHRIANDVLLISDTNLTMYESALSVLAYGRQPGGSLQVGSITDQTTLDLIGAAFLTGKTNPAPSRVVEVTHLVDFDAECGDTITVEADVLRLTEIGFQLDSDGTLRKAPVLETAYQQALKRGARMVKRLVDQYGDSKAAAKALDTGRTGVDAGPVEPVEMESWSWRDAKELEPGYWDVAETEVKPWQPYTAKEASRLVALIVVADWAEPDGADGLDQVTTGESEFLLLRNGVATSPPFIATLPETNLDDATDPTVFGIAYILGEGYADPNSRWSVASITNGGHVNGAATIWSVDPT
mgnify:CR=1 FL=1